MEGVNDESKWGKKRGTGGKKSLTKNGSTTVQKKEVRKLKWGKTYNW